MMLALNYRYVSSFRLSCLQLQQYTEHKPQVGHYVSDPIPQYQGSMPPYAGNLLNSRVSEMDSGAI